MDQYLEIIKECNKLSYPIGRFRKLEEKYGMTWEEYSALFRYTCVAGSINQGLLDDKKYTQDFVEYIYKGADKLPKDNYPRLYAAVSFSPHLDWSLNALRSTSFNVHTPLYFFKDVKYMAVFDDIRNMPSIYKFSMYPRENEVLLTPQYPYDLEAYDIDYLPNKYFIYYKNKEKSQSKLIRKVEDAIFPTFHEYLIKVHSKKVLTPSFGSSINEKPKWDIQDDIDIFENNILHYYIGQSKRNEIKKYISLINKPNKHGITPAMKIINKGMYDILKKYKNLIDFTKVDNSGKNMTHYLTSRVILSSKEDLNVFAAMYILLNMCPYSFNTKDNYGYTSLDYCCYSDLFVYIEQYSGKVSINPSTMRKIFLSETMHHESKINIKDFISLLLRHKIPYTSEMGHFFSTNLERLELFSKIRSKKIKNGLDEDGENIFFAYLRYNVNTKYAKEDISYLVENYGVNMTNIYDENLGMAITLNDTNNFVKVLSMLKKHGMNFLHRNKWGDTVSAYIIF